MPILASAKIWTGSEQMISESVFLHLFNPAPKKVSMNYMKMYKINKLIRLTSSLLQT